MSRDRSLAHRWQLMARQPRLEFEGAAYHVMSRGNHGEGVFCCREDRELFLATLDEACAKTNGEVHSYVLMSNHYHQELKAMKKSAPEKQATAWAIKRLTTVSNRWISQRWSMGYPTNVTNAAAMCRKPSTKELKRAMNQVRKILKM
jgi:REP element-mobilizing transposase RayT